MSKGYEGLREGGVDENGPLVSFFFSLFVFFFYTNSWFIGSICILDTRRG